MSRRRKLALTLGVALALVLAGLGAYTYYCWTAENPLRFRLVKKGEFVMVKLNPDDSFKQDVIPCEIEVVNTKPFPIHLEYAQLGIFVRDCKVPTDDSAKLFSGPDNYLNLATLGVSSMWSTTPGESIYHYNSPPIPGYGVTRHQLLVGRGFGEWADWSKVQVNYVWMSRMKNRGYQMHEWAKRLAARWTEEFYTPLPQDDSTTTLELALPATSSP